MSKLKFHPCKVLKLTNVFKCRILFREKEFDLNITVEKMKTYIKLKGAMQIGPLIQYTETFINEIGELDVYITIMFQCSNYIHDLAQPYSIESVIRIPNAMYCRYIGPESKLKFAYDKINLEAFENDIELCDNNYTIFVGEHPEEETITADVFIPRK